MSGSFETNTVSIEAILGKLQRCSLNDDDVEMKDLLDLDVEMTNTMDLDDEMEGV